MKKRTVSLAWLAVFAAQIFAQNLPVRTVTVFKNGRSLVQKSGKVQTPGGKFVLKDLPDALFGTFWSSGDLSSVFSVLDSVEQPSKNISKEDLLRKNVGKTVRLALHSGGQNSADWLDGTLEQVFENPRLGSVDVLVKTPANRWVSISSNQISRLDFPEKPNFDIKNKVGEKRLEFNFKTSKPEQELSMSYLTGNLGWTPVYRLELTEKNKGKLALRAEIINDADDLGNAELRLAVGVPNFMYAKKRSDLVTFGAEMAGLPRDYDLNPYRGNVFQNQRAYDFDMNLAEVTVPSGEGGDFEGSQAEDFYFYSISPGNFPKGSRFQYPVFEADIAPAHFYECNLQRATPSSYKSYQNDRQANEPQNPVSHFVEFLNPTKFPFTTGAANISSKSGEGLQPISQDLLPYTPAGTKCKVKIAQSPEIKVTHAEGDTERQENARKFFSSTFDRVKIEGQLCAVNYKKEPVVLKIRREFEGTPGKSEVKWTTAQEQATLRVNPSFVAEWEIELKPGEEKKWKYDYEVFVNY